MFITNHATTTIIICRFAGLSTTESVIAGAVSTMNDVVPFIDYVIRWAMNRNAEKFGKVYDYMHEFKLPIVLLFPLAWAVSFGLGADYTVIIAASFFAYASHIVIDSFWHLHEEPFGYRWWGIAGDVIVALFSVIFFAMAYLC